MLFFSILNIKCKLITGLYKGVVAHIVRNMYSGSSGEKEDILFDRNWQNLITKKLASKDVIFIR